MKSITKHWDALFSEIEDEMLGWYETDLSKTFDLLNQIKNWQDSTLFISGAGTSLLIDALLEEPKVRLVLNDISITALDKVKERLAEKSERVDWLCQNIAEPFKSAIPLLDVWIDRAVLHFLTKEAAIQRYFENIKEHLKKGGYAIFAEFSKAGAEQCAGLNIHQYSTDELSVRLGESFRLVSSFNHVYINPRGDKKPYIYALYQKV